MKKKMFYGFSFFVFLTLLAAWQLASAELASLQSQKDTTTPKQSTELALLK